MPDELEERLKSHARSFDSLLSLIPAKLYYGEDVSDQWQRKKQTPEQKKAAKLAKLDPDNWKSAKDVMDERAAAAKKRKREEEDEHDDENGKDQSPDDADADAGSDDAMSGIATELPKAVYEAEQKAKKRRLDNNESGSTKKPSQPTQETEEERRKRIRDQKAAKRERKQERKAKAKEKLERQKAKKSGGTQQLQSTVPKPDKRKSDMSLSVPIELEKSTPTEDKDEDDKDEDENKLEEEQEQAEDNASTATSSDEDQAEVFSPPQESGTSSTSSVLVPSFPDEANAVTASKASFDKPPVSGDTETQTPRERLRAAISQLRANRKADGPGGKGPKSRQELLQQRRLKEDERKAAKKEAKRREKEEEARKQDEEIARRFSPGGSGSLLASPRSPLMDGPSSSAADTSNNFSFGRIAFDDGTQLDPSISGVLAEHKKKGPTDTAAAFKAAQAKQTKLKSLDETKRKEIEEKDMWLNAKRRAHGEHVRDNTNLLKKALKRQQGQKKKSEKEWNERIEGVQKSQEVRQKKRTENLSKRKEDKRAGNGKKVKRPGFEGSFKGRTGGKGKKA